MFRYRQTQQLQRDLERRFARYLKPFGLGPTHEAHPELRDKDAMTTPKTHADKAAPSARRVDQPAQQAS